MKFSDFFQAVEKYYETEVDYKTLKFLNRFYLLLLLLYYLGLYKYVGAMFGADGIYGYSFLTSVSGANTTYDYDVHQYWQILSKLTSSESIYFIYAALILLLCSSLLNFFPIVTGVMALVLHCLFAVRSNLSYWGWGIMITPYLIYTFFGITKKSGPIWPVRLLQLNIATLYLDVVLNRIGDVAWGNGNMLYETLNQSMFFRFPISWDSFVIMLKAMTYGGLAIEIVAPFCLMTGFFRRPVLVLLILFHVCLEVLTNVGFWNIMLIPSFLVFLKEEEQKNILGYLSGLHKTAGLVVRVFLKKAKKSEL